MPTLPKISVNIPIKPESDIKTVISSLKKIKYPPEQTEIIIVEGNQIARQRNLALKKSKGEIIYLLDNDSAVKSTAFEIIASEFKKSAVAAVGGPSLTKKDKNSLSFVIACALETYFGAMRMRLRYSSQKMAEAGSEYHLIGANLALRKKIVKKLGGFNEKIMPNEETELLRRIKKAGYKLVYKKELSIYRQQRKSIWDLANQFHHYGIGRMKQIVYNGSFEDVIFFVPIIFVLYLFSLLFYDPVWYSAPLLLYLGLSFATSLKATLKYKQFGLLFTLPLIFPVIHISYALGLQHEIIRRIFLKKQSETRQPKLKVKTLYLQDLS
ncbi:hypothetical protein A2963_00770 [Candidatus Roizmanbacteria bacterium RIFCSPLOWO2_01_FULL_40_13]|nr:MAG: hypothetical protein A2963_00770 [Candidatus Roizmanbacteria bacterium RIFCSPLOWO2_01_FULL_40_13]